MYTQMAKQNKKFYKRFLPQYTLVKALHLNYTGKALEAISLLKDFKFDKFKNQITYTLDLKLTYIMILFQQKEYRKALRYHQELYHSDAWYTEKSGIIWVIKKNTAHLKNKKEDRVLRFLSLATSYYHNKDLVDSESFISKIENTLLKDTPEQEDIFTLSFYIWLKSKAEKIDFYQTTLQTILQVH